MCSHTQGSNEKKTLIFWGESNLIGFKDSHNKLKHMNAPQIIWFFFTELLISFSQFCTTNMYFGNGYKKRKKKGQVIVWTAAHIIYQHCNIKWLNRHHTHEERVNLTWRHLFQKYKNCSKCYYKTKTFFQSKNLIFSKLKIIHFSYHIIEDKIGRHSFLVALESIIRVLRGFFLFQVQHTKEQDCF